MPGLVIPREHELRILVESVRRGPCCGHWPYRRKPQHTPRISTKPNMGIEKMLENSKRWLNERVHSSTAKEKLYVPAIVVFLAVVLLNVNAHWFWPGLTVSVFGMLLQSWIIGCARGAERLSINGPYLFVRNPLYIARFFLLLGLVLMTGIPWLLPVFAVLYVLWVLYRVQLEEEALEEKEPAEYKKYSKHVRRFLPRFRPYPRGRFLYFKMRYFKRHHGLESLLFLIGLYILCYVLAFYPT